MSTDHQKLLTTAILSNNELEIASQISKLQYSDFSENPFFEAIDVGKMKILEMLFEKFPQIINTTDYRKVTPFHHALTSNNFEAAIFIFKNCQCQLTNPVEMANQILTAAIKKERIDIIDFIICYSDIDNLSTDQNTPLHEAVLVNNEWIIKLLLSKNATVNIPNKFGDTPLHMAIRCGNNLAAKTLIKALPIECINKINNVNDTPLHLAVCTENIEIVKSLLKKGAVATIRNDKQDTAMDISNNQTINKLFRQKNKTKGFLSSIVHFFKKSQTNPEVTKCLITRRKSNKNMTPAKETQFVPIQRSKTQI